MIDYLRRLLDSETLAPHGICLLWRPELIWTHVVSDALIGVAYFSIPVALAVFAAKRRDVAFGWVFVLFAIFITACGVTHLFSIWTLWYPDYGAEAVVKLLTAVASVATAVALWPLLPRAIALPSPAQLQTANATLLARVAERDAALADLERATAQRLAAEEALRQAQKMEAVGQLTGGVAHDFNNLLTIVIANLDRLQRRVPAEDADARRAIDNALAGADRAAGLTRQLLTFARKQPLSPTEQDFNRLVEGMMPLLVRSVGEDIDIRTDPAPDLWPVSADANQIENCLLNLVVNARDAMPGGGTVTIATRNRVLHEDEVEELPPGEYVSVEVADTGVGMTEDVKARAFEPFFTTKGVGKGTGLGLSQVYGFIAQSNGKVLIDSAPGEGARVRILLPRAV